MIIFSMMMTHRHTLVLIVKSKAPTSGAFFIWVLRDKTFLSTETFCHPPHMNKISLDNVLMMMYYVGWSIFLPRHSFV